MLHHLLLFRKLPENFIGSCRWRIALATPACLPTEGQLVRHPATVAFEIGPRPYRVGNSGTYRATKPPAW